MKEYNKNTFNDSSCLSSFSLKAMWTKLKLGRKPKCFLFKKKNIVSQESAKLSEFVVQELFQEDFSQHKKTQTAFFFPKYPFFWG